MANNLIEHLKEVLTAVKQQIATEQNRMLDPCWQLETVYYVGKPVIDMLNNGEIDECDIPFYAFGSSQIWVNGCEETI